VQQQKKGETQKNGKPSTAAASVESKKKKIHCINLCYRE
jgi:hypothetical protein